MNCCSTPCNPFFQQPVEKRGHLYPIKDGECRFHYRHRFAKYTDFQLLTQVSALWDELHTRRPWRTANSAGNLSSFGLEGGGGIDSSGSDPKYLAVIAINTVLLKALLPPAPASVHVQLQLSGGHGLIVRTSLRTRALVRNQVQVKSKQPASVKGCASCRASLQGRGGTCCDGPGCPRGRRCGSCRMSSASSSASLSADRERCIELLRPACRLLSRGA